MKPGQRAIAGPRDQLLEPDPLLDLGALRRRAAVVPEDRRADHVTAGVEHDEAVHLPGQADAGDVVDAERGERLLARAPPVGRVLLGPARLRCRERIVELGARQNRAGLVDGERLHPRRADIEADRRAHP